MEYIDIFDENNNPTGEIKEKVQAHEDGNFHRTAHIWIMNNKKELLLQNRSATKKIILTVGTFLEQDTLKREKQCLKEL